MGAKERKDAANEVKVLSSLKHPYIVAYKDSFIEDGFLNIVMEYADGGDLFTRIQGKKVNDEVRGAANSPMVHAGLAGTEVHPRQAY